MEFNSPITAGNFSASSTESSRMENRTLKQMKIQTYQHCFINHRHKSTSREVSASIYNQQWSTKWKLANIDNFSILASSSVGRKMLLIIFQEGTTLSENNNFTSTKMLSGNRLRNVKVYRVLSCCTQPMEVPAQVWEQIYCNIFHTNTKRNQKLPFRFSLPPDIQLPLLNLITLFSWEDHFLSMLIWQWPLTMKLCTVFAKIIWK